MNRLRTIFSSSLITMILVLGLILVNIWRQENFRNFKPDKSRQIHSAYQIQKGKGYVTCHTDSLTLKTEICVPEFAWPIGYSAVLAGVNYYTHNFYKTAILIEYFALFAFFAVFFLLLSLLDSDKKTLNFLLFFLMSSFAPIHYLTTTCLLSLTCFMAAVIFYLYFEKGKLNGILAGISIGVLMFLSTYFRFAYYPITAGFIVFFCWKIVENGDRTKYLLSTLAFVLVYCSLYFYAQSSYSYTPAKGALQIADFGKGFYPENLLKTDDFITKFFIFLNPVYALIEGNNDGDYHHPLSLALRILGLAITVFVIILFTLKGLSILKNKNLTRSFYLLGFITLGATVIPYMYLSLITVAFQVGTLANYTYVQETRYYAPLIPFFLIFVTKYAFGNEKFSIGVRYGLKIAAFTGSLMTLAIFSKIMFSETPLQGTYDFYYRNPIENFKILTEEKAKYPEERWIYADSTAEPNPLISLSGCEIYNGNFLKNLQGKTLPENAFLICPESFAEKVEKVIALPLKKEKFPVKGWSKLSAQ